MHLSVQGKYKGLVFPRSATLWFTSFFVARNLYKRTDASIREPWAENAGCLTGAKEIQETGSFEPFKAIASTSPFALQR